MPLFKPEQNMENSRQVTFSCHQKFFFFCGSSLSLLVSFFWGSDLADESIFVRFILFFLPQLKTSMGLVVVVLLIVKFFDFFARFWSIFGVLFFCPLVFWVRVAFFVVPSTSMSSRFFWSGLRSICPFCGHFRDLARRA